MRGPTAEQIAEHQRKTSELLEDLTGDRPEEPRTVEDTGEMFLGADPEQRAEDDAYRASKKALEEEDQSPTEIALLRNQVLELNEMVKKLMSQGLSPKDVVHEVTEQVEEERRRDIYAYYAKRNGGMVTIQIHSDPDPAKNAPVYVCHNGQSMLIPRGRPVQIPYYVLELLDHAKVETVSPDMDGEGNVTWNKYSYLVYPYAILDAAAAEILNARAAA